MVREIRQTKRQPKGLALFNEISGIAEKHGLEAEGLGEVPSGLRQVFRFKKPGTEMTGKEENLRYKKLIAVKKSIFGRISVHVTEGSGLEEKARKFSEALEDHFASKGAKRKLKLHVYDEAKAQTPSKTHLWLTSYMRED